MALTVSTDIMKYRESTSDPWKNLIIEPSGTTMYFPSQTVNTASNAEIFRITDGAITTQTVVVECTFASPSSVTSDVTWTSYDGYIAFYGTCTSATTADVTLGNATVPTPETPLAIAKGGTGADNAADARDNLGLSLQIVSVDVPYTVSGGGVFSANLFTHINSAMPNGYSFKAFAGASTNSDVVFTVNMIYENSAYSLYLRNIGGSSVSTSFHVSFLCANS